eukprot:447215_1
MSNKLHTKGKINILNELYSKKENLQLNQLRNILFVVLGFMVSDMFGGVGSAGYIFAYATGVMIAGVFIRFAAKEYEQTIILFMIDLLTYMCACVYICAYFFVVSLPTDNPIFTYTMAFYLVLCDHCAISNLIHSFEALIHPRKHTKFYHACIIILCCTNWVIIPLISGTLLLPDCGGNWIKFLDERENFELVFPHVCWPDDNRCDSNIFCGSVSFSNINWNVCNEPLLYHWSFIVMHAFVYFAKDIFCRKINSGKSKSGNSKKDNYKRKPCCNEIVTEDAKEELQSWNNDASSPETIESSCDSSTFSYDGTKISTEFEDIDRFTSESESPRSDRVDDQLSVNIVTVLDRNVIVNACDSFTKIRNILQLWEPLQIENIDIVTFGEKNSESTKKLPKNANRQDNIEKNKQINNNQNNKNNKENNDDNNQKQNNKENNDDN